MRYFRRSSIVSEEEKTDGVGGVSGVGDAHHSWVSTTADRDAVFTPAKPLVRGP